MSRMMYFYPPMHMGFAFGLFPFFLLWLLLLCIIPAMIWRRERRYDMYHNHHTSEPESMRILKNRYARGEISREVYDQMCKDLNADLNKY